jgi:Mrp family chromosome partitioning ATPase
VIAVSVVLLVAGFPRLDSETEVHRLNLPVIGKVPLIKKQGANEDLPGYSLEYLKIMNYRIMREMRDAKCPIIVVSSPHAREGKSTVTHFLSLAAQNPVRKTLLIDGDLLTSHPNKFFGILEDHTPGLKSILENPTMTDYQSLIVKTSFDGIYFLPRGGRFDPSVMANFSKPMEQVLAALRKEYDTISHPISLINGQG